MRFILTTAVLLTLPTVSFASGADGVWKTEPGDSGGYLEVTISACGDKTCGKITKAFKGDGSEDGGYANLGKPIIEGMASSGEGSYEGGTIWDPEKDKTYKSKMSVSGNTLEVKGCVGPICSGQNWTRVK